MALKEIMESNWKKHLLKSGLPFEYEVKECFVKQGCTVWDEFSYLKKDENAIEKEFSYDLDANIWKGGHSVDFLIECKYKTEPTKWFFTPDPYYYQSDLSRNSFFHPIDHFSKHTFLFKNAPLDEVIKDPLGPFCLKGVELFKDQHVETNITKAIAQLSYAFIDKLISSLDEQLNSELFSDKIFLHIPIIITNADLHIINKNLTTQEIESAKSIDNISTQHNFLLYHNKIGENLRDYNFDKLLTFFASSNTSKIEAKLNSFTKDINHLINVISTNYSPQLILIMHHDKNHSNYENLFSYINFILTDTAERNLRIKKVQEEMKDKHLKFEEMLKEKKRSTTQPKKH